MACFTAKEMQLECKHRVSGRLLNLNRIDDLLRASYAIMGAFNKRGSLDIFGDAARGDVEINAAEVSAIEDFDKDFTMIQLIQVDINKLPEAINTPQMKIRDMQSEVKAVEKLFDQKYDQPMAGAKADQEKQLKEQKQLMDERKQLQQIMQSQQAQSKVGKLAGGSKQQPPSSTTPAGGTQNTGTTVKPASKQQVSFTLNTDDGNANNADSVDRQLQELERQFQPHSVLADDKGIISSSKVAQVNQKVQNERENQQLVTKSQVQETTTVKNTFNQITNVEKLERQLDNRQSLRPKNELFKTRDDMMRSKSKMGSSAAETLLKRLGEVRRPEGYVQQRSGLEQSGTSGPSGPKTDESLAATSLKSSAGILRNKSDEADGKSKHQHDIMESTIVLQRVEQPQQPPPRSHAKAVKQQKQLEAQIQEQLENQQQREKEQKDGSDESHDVQSIFKRKVEQSSHTLTSSSNQRTPSIMKDSVQANKDQIALSEAEDWKSNDRQQLTKKPFIKTQTKSQIKRPTTTSNEEIRKRQIQLNQRIKRIQEQQQAQTGKVQEQKIKTTSTVDQNVEEDNIIVESTELTNTLSKSQKVSQLQSSNKLSKSKQEDIQKKDLVVSKSSKVTQQNEEESNQQQSEVESNQEDDLTNTMVATGYSKAQGTKQDIIQTITERMTDRDDVSQINNRSMGSSDDQVTELIQQAQKITQPERPVEDLINEYKEVESAQKKLLTINGLQSSGASQLTKDSSASSIDSNAGVVKHSDNDQQQAMPNAFTQQNQVNEYSQQNQYGQYNLSQKTFPGNDGKTQMQQSSMLPSAILPVGVPISNPNIVSQSNFGQASMQNPAQLQSNINQLQEESDRYQQSMRQRLANIESQLYDNQRRVAQNPTLMSLNQTAISEAFHPGAQLGVDSITSMQHTQQLFEQSRKDLQSQIQAPININAPQVTLPHVSRSGLVPQGVSVSNVVHGSDSGDEDFDPLISRRIASQVMQKSITPGVATGGVSKLPWNNFDKSSVPTSSVDPVGGQKPSIVPTSSFFTGKDATVEVYGAKKSKVDQSMTGTVMSNTTDYKVFLDDLQNQVHNIQNKLQQISSLAESSGDAEAEMAKIRADVAGRNAASLVDSDSFATDGVGSRYGNRGASKIGPQLGASGTTMGTSVSEMRNRFGAPRLDGSISSSGVNSSGVSQSLLDRVQRNNAALLAQMSSRVSDIDSDAQSEQGIEVDLDTDDD